MSYKKLKSSDFEYFMDQPGTINKKIYSNQKKTNNFLPKRSQFSTQRKKFLKLTPKNNFLKNFLYLPRK